MGANINAQSAIGRSPLHYACDANRVGCVRLLLELQADSNLCTLSHQTPLHICCAYGSYEALLELLHGHRDVIDVDAVDMRGQLPEAVTTDKKIQRCVRKYRASLVERRQASLIDEALKRLFLAFDQAGSSYIMPEECAESQVLLAQHLAQDTDAGDKKFSEAAHLDLEGLVSWEEFRNSHLSIIGALPIEHQKLMEKLCELEEIILNEVMQADSSDRKEPLPVQTPRVQQMAMRRHMGMFGEVTAQYGEL